MSFLGFGPTELRIVLGIGVLKAAASPEIAVPMLGPTLLFDVGGGGAIAGLTIAFATSVWRTARSLYDGRAAAGTRDVNEGGVTARVGPFMAVGALGFALQIAALALFTAAGWPLIAAIAAAVEVAILHNFCWHERWTWRDRAAARRLAGTPARAFMPRQRSRRLVPTLFSR